jgi:hypothetical protein
MADERHGATLLSWEFPEHEQHVRGRTWYVVATLIAIALLVYAFATKNFLFAIMIVMLAVVMYLRDARGKPPMLSFVITEKGILLADRFMPYERLQDFWFVTEEDAPKTLYFHPRSARPRLRVPIGDRDPSEIRNALRGRLPENEDEHEEPASDAIGRALKL